MLEAWLSRRRVHKKKMCLELVVCISFHLLLSSLMCCYSLHIELLLCMLVWCVCVVGFGVGLVVCVQTMLMLFQHNQALIDVLCAFCSPNQVLSLNIDCHPSFPQFCNLISTC